MNTTGGEKIREKVVCLWSLGSWHWLSLSSSRCGVRFHIGFQWLATRSEMVPAGCSWPTVCSHISHKHSKAHTQALVQTTSVARMQITQWGEAVRGERLLCMCFVVFIFFPFCQSYSDRPLLALGQSGVNNPFIPSKIIATLVLVMTLSYRILRMLTLYN